MENNNIVDVNEIDFESKVLEESSNRLVIVDFWAPWCGPCKQLTPILENIISQYPDKVFLAKINIDENQQIASQLRIQSIPAVFAFKEKQVVNAFQGVIPETEIKKFIEKSLGEKLGNNFSNLIDQYPVTPYLDSRDSFIKWTHFIHNKVNQSLDKPEIDFYTALEKTALSRFRPILLTTMTTVFGLLPLIFETSMQAQFLIPMAISLSYGIIIATLLTLVLLPALIVAISNFRMILYAYSKIVFPNSDPSFFTKIIVFFPAVLLIPVFLVSTLFGYINGNLNLFNWILRDVDIKKREDFEPRVREQKRLKEMI